MLAAQDGLNAIKYAGGVDLALVSPLVLHAVLEATEGLA